MVRPGGEGRDGRFGARGRRDLTAGHRGVDRTVEGFAAQQVAAVAGACQGGHFPAGTRGLGGPLDTRVSGAVLRDGHPSGAGVTDERLQFPDPFLGCDEARNPAVAGATGIQSSGTAPVVTTDSTRSLQSSRTLPLRAISAR